MPRKQIRLRNAITEAWNLGDSIATIAHENGLSEDRVNALLNSARAGYHTPADQLAAEAIAAAKKEAKKVK